MLEAVSYQKFKIEGFEIEITLIELVAKLV